MKTGVSLLVLCMAVFAAAEETSPVPALLDTAMGRFLIYDVTGGVKQSSVITEFDATSPWANKRPGPPEFGDLSFAFGPSNKAMLQVFADTLNGNGKRVTIAINEQTQSNTGGAARRFLSGTVRSGTIMGYSAGTAPKGFRCSIQVVDATEPFNVQFNPKELSVDKSVPWGKSGRYVVDIEGLDCSGVTEVAPITFEQSLTDLDGDGVAESASLSMSDLVIDLPLQEALKITGDFVAGKTIKTRTGHMMILDDEKRVAMRLSLVVSGLSFDTPRFDVKTGVFKCSARLVLCRCDHL